MGLKVVEELAGFEELELGGVVVPELEEVELLEGFDNMPIGTSS